MIYVIQLFIIDKTIIVAQGHPFYAGDSEAQPHRKKSKVARSQDLAAQLTSLNLEIERPGNFSCKSIRLGYGLWLRLVETCFFPKVIDQHPSIAVRIHYNGFSLIVIEKLRTDNTTRLQ